MNKSYLKRLALEVREELSVDHHGPFDPYALAALYGVPIFDVGELDCPAPVIAHFSGPGVAVLSGALVPLNDGSTAIIENGSHSVERRRATVSHELAHLILEHEFGARLVGERGCRVTAGDQELEASEFGAELLLPAAAALVQARRRVTDEDVAAAFAVSVELAAWRMNSTGARKRAERERAKRQP